MTLDEDECWKRLEAARHGVLSTLHPRRGVDAVPVVFALDGRRVLLPIDMVKPKRGEKLQRTRNLRADPRCVLLVEHYSEDWTKLWWVRVHADAVTVDTPVSELSSILGRCFDQYASPGAIADVIVLQPTAVTGWAASSS